MSRIISRSRTLALGSSLALGLFFPLTAVYGQETTLYEFTGGNDGGNPPCGLISGGKGLLPGVSLFYGTTQIGGASNYGTVFEIGNTGFESPLYSFTGGTDGAYPFAGVITDPSGDIYGTTAEGGAYGEGVVFKLAGGTETVLHPFAGGSSDGALPVASLIIDGAGNLYGTTYIGGTDDMGTVFKVTPSGTESILHSFSGGDGAYPAASLVMDSTGTLYGTTYEGGTSTNCAGGCGTIFKLPTGGAESVIHSFSGGDGALPAAALIREGNGDLYGTTAEGGSNNLGAVFEFSNKGKLVVLHSFAGGSDGSYPVSPVAKKSGFLYGTTSSGGTSGDGTVYKTPDKPASDTVLHSFTGGSDGADPKGGLLYHSGVFFGAAYAGANPGCNSGNGCGTVFEIKR
ncbi:MAG TPA: choice-of-anchor tandem repeat GloVer-containing protein [Rhizomicrobium sp.]|nr:choice-of-anchor tandem repeat GloVer-containing protein [Rhizomicrobium sp.]